MASISPTTSLATFQTSHASSSKLRPHVRLSEVRNSKQQLGVLTVQGDGIWTYDLSTPRPTTSFTVPPSTIFAGPAVSYYPWISQSDREKEKQRATDGDEEMDDADASSRVRVTAVVVYKGEQVKKSDEGRVLWVWTGEEGEKRAIQVDGPPIQHLIHLERQSGLLAVHLLDKLKYIDSNFNIRDLASTLKSTKDDSILAADYLNLRGDWRLVTVSSSGRVVICKLDFQACELEVLHDGSLCKDKVELLRAEIDAEGGVTAISSATEVISVDYKDLRSPPSPPFPILASPSQPQFFLPLPYPSKPISLIPSASTSTIALATTSQESPAVLTTLPILLGAENASSVVDIQILSRTSPFSWIVGFVVTHKHAQGDSGRSIVYTTEVSLPEKGIGLNMLLGSQERTALYFNSTFAKGKDDAEADELVSSIEKALSSSGGSMEARAAQAERLWAGKSTSPLPESAIKKLVKVIFDAAIPKSSSSGADVGVGRSAALKRTGPYAKQIVADLLEKRAINDDMLAGGFILAGLLPCGDWDLIPRAIDILPTISSASVISCLTATLHPTTSSPPPPPFVQLYAQILRLPPPPPTWRVEMRQRVPVADAAVFLETLLGWVEKHEAAQASLGTWESSGPETDDSLPPLPAVLQHASLLLDSHIALFLSYPPSHPALERLQATIAPLLEAQSDYRALRAPIEALLTLADRATRDKEESAARREAQRPEDRKRRGKASNGLVELRTEVIGKWRVEDFAF